MAFTETDGRVERGEAAKANIEWRNRRARTQFAVLLFEDGHQRFDG
jgi:hypothetical protein